MAITWWDNGTGKCIEQTHEGRVLDITRSEVRVMSDIWANQITATVLDEQGAVVTVDCGTDFELCARSGQVIVDAPEDALQAYQAAKAAKAAQQAADEVEHRARNLVLQVHVGSAVVVRRGRKVPRGTTGIVTRIMSGCYGLRATVKDNTGAAHWVDPDNLDVIHPMLKDGEPIPGATWADIRAHMNANQIRIPIKGETVRLKASPEIVGSVFWTQDARIGFKASPDAEPTWTDAYSVEIQDTDGTFIGYEIPESEFRVWTVPLGRVKHLPPPMNRTREIQATGNVVTLKDHKGRVLLTCPVKALPDILAQMT